MDEKEKAMNSGREIVDMAGRKVAIPENIKSVFAGSLYGYTMLSSLAPELIAATPFPPREKDRRFLHPHLHNLPFIEKITEIEAIEKVRPDLIIVWADKEKPYHKKSEQAAEAMGIPYVYVIVGNLGDVPDFPAAYEFLGSLLGKEERAARLADYCRKALNETLGVVTKVRPEERPGVYYAEGEDGLMTEFDDSLHAHLLKLVGDVNLVRGHMTEHKGLEKISLEQVVDLDPEVIITWSRNFAESAKGHSEWRKTAAVKSGRVHVIPNCPFNWFDRPPCFMRIIGLKWLTQCLYPDCYRVDMIKETREFYSLFFDREISIEDAENILSQNF